MYKINNDVLEGFYNLNSHTLDSLLNYMIFVSSNQLLTTQAYGLFYSIRENIGLNYFIFRSTIIELDPFIFPSVKRNTRCLIESFIDLYNIANSADYIELLKKIEIDRERDPQKRDALAARLGFDEVRLHTYLRKFIKNRNDKYWVAASTKFTIAGKLGLNELADSLHEDFKRYSPFSHSSLFVDSEAPPAVELHLEHARYLLKLNLTLLGHSLGLLLQFFLCTYSLSEQVRCSLTNSLAGVQGELTVLLNSLENSSELIVWY